MENLGKRAFLRLGNETIGLERLRYIAIPAAIKRLDFSHSEQVWVLTPL